MPKPLQPKSLSNIISVLPTVTSVALAGLVLVTAACGPKVGPADDRKIDSSPALVERGRYLANGLGCIECHSTRDHSKVGGPVVAGTEGGGGMVLTKERDGAPGSIPVPNITPTGLSDWSDGEIARAITSGVAKDGRALFPMMPYPVYSKLAREDVDALVAYLRSLPPVGQKDVGERSLNFPLGIIVNTIPKEPSPMALPADSDVEGKGAYLAQVAGCMHCHTIEKRGVYKEGMHYAGGHTFKSRGTLVQAPNITPHPTGLGSWTEEVFVARFAAYRDPTAFDAPQADDKAIAFMPWWSLSQLTDDDLKAIYGALQKVPPVDHTVQWHQPLD